MIPREDWEEAYDLIVYITSKVPVLEKGFKEHVLLDMCPCISYYDNRIQYISTGHNTSDLVQSNIKFYSLNNYSFVRSKEHRENKVNIHFAYVPGNGIRLGSNVITNFDFSEENIFQQSLVLDHEMAEDLEFICFLRSKKFNETLVFKRNSYSIEGLKMIKERVQEVLCYLSEQK